MSSLLSPVSKLSYLFAANGSNARIRIVNSKVVILIVISHLSLKRPEARVEWFQINNLVFIFYQVLDIYFLKVHILYKVTCFLDENS